MRKPDIDKRKDALAEGLKFGRLVVLTRVEVNDSTRRLHYKCKCDCGNETTVMGYTLLAGATRSCGCLQREHAARCQPALAKATIRHGAMIGVSSGEAQDPMRFRAHNIWRGMLRRCYDPRTVGYKGYGARGISVCERWRDSFLNFIADMGLPQANQSIERENNNDNYHPGNCRWASSFEQMNNIRSNRLITLDGKTMTVSQWARERGMPINKVFKRLNRGWHPERALRN
jgi:hypothetical protein